MDFFEKIASEKKLGKYKARFTAKWVNLSRIKTMDSEIIGEEIIEYLNIHKILTTTIQNKFADFSVEFDDDTDIVNNVSVYEWVSGGLSDDLISIKWIEIIFYFDTDFNVKNDWSDIEESLRFNFYFDLEVENSRGYIVFQFSDWEDNAVELISS
jgi:hypothetical protein